MPAVNREERVGRVILWLSTAWFFFTAAWGIDATPGGGHLGSNGAAIASIGEHMVRWRTFYPVMDWYSVTPPVIEHTYCHHPFGMEWAAAFFALFFRHKDFLASLPAVFESTAMPPLLYGIGRRIGGPMAGAAAALGFVVLPITIGYSCFASLEVLTMFGAALFFWGHLAYQESGKTRHLVASLCGCFVCASGDWAGYLIMGSFLGWALLRAYVLPRWMTPRIRETYHRWWALSVAVSLGLLVITLAMFKHANAMADWIGSADARAGADELPLAVVLESRAAWIDFSFTPLAIALGKIALPVAVVRFLVRRRDEELVSLVLLFGAAVQYVGFKRGADVHIFWPHYFGIYFAVAMAQLAATARDAARWASARLPPARAAAVVMATTILFGIVPLLVIFPDGARSLKIWRATGGRYNDHGALFRSHVDINWLMSVLIRPRMHLAEPIGYHPGTQWGYEHTWSLGGIGQPAEVPSSSYPFWVGRGSGMGADEMKKLVSSHRVRFYGDVMFVDREGDAPAPLEAYSLNEREPGPLEWFFAYNTEPVRSIGNTPDPFLTWEWRTHLGQDAVLPTTEPQTLDERRIAYNVAVSTGDAARAEKLRETIEAELDRTRSARFSDGHALIGVRVTKGVQPRLEAWFEAGGPTPGDTTFSIHSIVDKPLRTSLIPADPTERDMAFPPSLSTKLWKKGFLYRIDAELKHRIGEERYVGLFLSRDGTPAPVVQGAARLDLAVLR